MTGYRCWHDVDTISSTSRCRRCKRGMTGMWWQGTDVDTMSIRYRQHRDVDDVNDVNEVWQCTDVDDVNDVNEVWQVNNDRVPMLTWCRYDIVNIAMSTISKNIVNWTYLQTDPWMDRQTLEKVIPMCRYASQATQQKWYWPLDYILRNLYI